MNRLLKIILITLGVLLAAIIVPLAALVLLVDPDSFKPQIVAAVKQQTGREFRIDGELGWSFYPVLGIELGHTELGNAPGFGDKPMLAVQRVAVGVELRPLLDRELNIAQLRLEQPQINLAVDKNGRSNWDDIVERQQKDTTTPAPGAPVQKADKSATTAPRIAISGLYIIDGALSWHDAQNAQAVQVTALTIETGAINASTPVDVALSMHVSSKSPAIETSISFDTSVLFDTAKRTLSLQDAVLKTVVVGKDIPAGKQTLALNLKNVAVDLDEQTLAIPALAASVAGVELKASVEGRHIFDKPQFAGQLTVAEISLRKLLGDAGVALPVMADGNTLQKFAFAAVYTATPQRVDMSKIKLNLDDSVISGSLYATLDDITQVGFDLALDAINADRYMAQHADTPAARAAAGSASSATVNDSETFAALDTLAVNGKIGIGKLHVQNLDLTNVTIKLKTEGRTVVVEPLMASLYGGRAAINANIDGRGMRAQSHAAIMLLGLNVGNFLDAFLQKRGPIEGNGNIVADVIFIGLDGDSIMRSATGKGELRFLDGAVRGINIAQEIRNALALLKKQPRQDASQKTDFTAMVVPFTIDKGVLSWHDMTANSPLLRIGSKGDFNLLTQEVDTRVDASVVSTLKGQGGEPLSEIAGFLVPVKVRGAISDPRISIDIKKVLQQTVLGDKQQELEARVDERKEELKLKADEKKEEARKKAGEELKRGLDKLFKKKE